MAELYAERQVKIFGAIQEKWKVHLITKYMLWFTYSLGAIDYNF